MNANTVTELFSRAPAIGSPNFFELHMQKTIQYSIGVELNTTKNKEMACAIQYLLIMDTYKTTPHNIVLHYTPPGQKRT